MEAYGVDIKLEETGHLSPHFVAPVVQALLSELFRRGFDETASVSSKVKDGVLSLTISKPPPELREILKRVHARAAEVA